MISNLDILFPEIFLSLSIFAILSGSDLCTGLVGSGEVLTVCEGIPPDIWYMISLILRCFSNSAVLARSIRNDSSLPFKSTTCLRRFSRRFVCQAGVEVHVCEACCWWSI